MKLIWKSGEQRDVPLSANLKGCMLNRMRPSSVELSAREIQLLAQQLNSDLISVRDNAAKCIHRLSCAIFHYE